MNPDAAPAIRETNPICLVGTNLRASPNSVEKIEHCISFLAGKAAQTIYREAREILAPFAITPVQYAVLQVLWESDGRTGAEIGGRLVLDSATITGVIDRLEKLELVERRADNRDRRINRIHLTRKGKTRRKPLQSKMDGLNRRVMDHFGADASQVWQFLEKLASFSSAATEESALTSARPVSRPD